MKNEQKCLYSSKFLSIMNQEKEKYLILKIKTASL